MDSSPLPDFRARILARYVTTHASVSAAAAAEGFARRRPFLVRFVRAHFPPARDARVLDLGCGHGALVRVARELGWTRVEGVDASPEQVAAARALGVEGVREGDLRATLAAVPPGSLDAVVLFDLFHYFAKPEQMAVADAVHRALAPGGRLILHLPNAEAIFAARMRHWDVLAEDAFTRASIAQLLGACGFAAVASFEDAPAVHGPASAARAALWKLVRGAARLALMVETGESGRDAVFSQCLTAVARK